MFTDSGEWRYHGFERPQLVDGGILIAGTRLAQYECSHPHGLRTTCFIVSLSQGAFEEDPDPLFARTIFPTIPEMLAHRRAIAQLYDEPERLESHVYSLFDLVSNAAARQSSSPRFDIRMAYAKRIIRERSHEQITIAAIARELHLSRFTFTRRFLSHAGITPHAYLANVRIERAKRQLRSTKLSIDEISAANGFGSISHFSNAFRRATGSTATAFRRE